MALIDSAGTGSQSRPFCRLLNRRNPPRATRVEAEGWTEGSKIKLLEPPVSRLRLVIVVAVPFWIYVTIAQMLIAYAWTFGLMEPSEIAPVGIRVAQHVLSMLLSIPMYLLALRTGFPAHRRWYAGAVQLLLGLSFAALVRPTLLLTWMLLQPEIHAKFASEFATDPPGQFGAWLRTTVTYLMIYGFGLALVCGASTYVALRDEKLHAARLQNESMHARLQALRMQLNPHFLFNTLHTITALIGRQPNTAQEMLVRLSELLRRVLRDRNEDYVSLSREIELAQNYLDIESLRFRDRMTVRFDVEEFADGALVPSMILQPLVENAVKHSVANDEASVRIAVGARRDRQWLELTVRNSAAARTGEEATDGMGLDTTRARLRTMFGERHQVDIGYVSPDEFVARIRFPFVASAGEARELQ